MLKNTEIICLDEATSNIQDKIASKLQKNLINFAKHKNKALILITHRP